MRDVDPKLIYTMDKVREEINQKYHLKLSRNEFIKQTLDEAMTSKYQNEAKDRISVQLEEMIKYMQENNKALGRILYLVLQGDTGIALDGLDAISGLDDDEEENDQE